MKNHLDTNTVLVQFSSFRSTQTDCNKQHTANLIIQTLPAYILITSHPANTLHVAWQAGQVREGTMREQDIPREGVKYWEVFLCNLSL